MTTLMIMMMANLDFSYVGGLVDNTSLSSVSHHCLYRGGEVVVAGRYEDNDNTDSDYILEVVIEGDWKQVCGDDNDNGDNDDNDDYNDAGQEEREPLHLSEATAQ